MSWKYNKIRTNIVPRLLSVQQKFNSCVFTALLPDGLLSVVHITDDGMSILEPLEITDTHVVVKVPHLSVFGLVWDIVKRLWMTPVSGQVLLFLGPPNPITERRKLIVLLLPSNIPLDEVKLHVTAVTPNLSDHKSVLSLTYILPYVGALRHPNMFF